LRFRYSTEKNGSIVKKATVYTQVEHKINFSDVDNQAVYIIERLQTNGYETYIVGGAVRDLILGKKPKDFDIVTAASPAKIKKIFRNARIIGRRFRLVHVYFGPKIFEVSTFRSIKDGPTGNTFGTIEEDVKRRDFSLNALFYDPIKQLVVDYEGGMKDIRKRVIRPIIALPNIFTDDPVRMIRAVKYAAVSGFKLPFSLKLRIRKHSGLLAGVSPSRLTEEIFKIISSPHALEIVKGLDVMKIYTYLQPRAAEQFKITRGFKLRYFETMGKLNREDSANLKGEALAALIRDHLEDTVDWKIARGAEMESYKNTFGLARKFVLPMNPPRVELEKALKLLFAEHGLLIKKTRLGVPRQRIPRVEKPESIKAVENSPEQEARNVARKKRRRKKSNRANETPTQE
jgi:poly(A) polymerase